MIRLRGTWIRKGHVQTVLGCLVNGGHLAYVVGGCVRNDLIGQPISDIDIATDAEPLRVVDLAGKAGLRTVPTGIDHGTVTVIAEGVPHEVTTFRRDAQTDGRRAVVRFSRSLAEDAARRDFTMNALYADAQGNVTDPVSGFADLKAGHVRFIGDAGARIREDYLRILRFFRFLAWYGDPARGPDAEGFAACASLAEGLEGLSRERVGQEMRKLLAAPDPAPALASMQASGILGRILPGADARPTASLVHAEGKQPPSWVRRLAALGARGEAAALRLSKREQVRLEQIRGALASDEPASALAYRLGEDTARDALLIRSASLGRPVPQTLERDLAEGAGAKFPVAPEDLSPRLAGPALGARLREMEEVWIASGFRLTREELLDQ